MQGRIPPDFDATPRDDVLVVRLNLAHVGLPEIERLREPLLRLASGDPPRLLLDLAAVDSLCSEAVGVILGMSRRTVERGGRLVLCNLRPVVLQTFVPLPRHQALRPDWRGPFFARSLEEGLALCGGQRSARPLGGDA